MRLYPFTMYRMILITLLLLPAHARADRQDGELEVRQLAPDVYLHTSYGELPGGRLFPSNGLVVIEQGEAYIIDTPWPRRDTAQLLRWIEAAGYAPVASLSTHFHDDRSSGIAELNRLGIKTVASDRTNALLRAQGSEPASIGFEGATFSLLPGRVEVFYPGPGHSTDNVVVWLPRERILHGGCLVRALGASGMGNTADASLEHWPGSIQALIDHYPEVQQVIPGHGAPGGAELLTHTQELARQ